MIELIKPRGPAGRHRIDLSTLTPKHRAMAEVIAQTPLRRIRIKSVHPMRELYTPPHAEMIYSPGSPRLDEPMTNAFEGWLVNHTPGRLTVPQILEYEARTRPGWYPIADDGSDLPSSADRCRGRRQP